MGTAKKSSDIGLGQAKQLCEMTAKRRLEFIADGLPIIFDSARSLMGASAAMVDFPREAEILEGHADEEAAKILILVDVVRCPAKHINSRIGPMMRWFYDHLARLIYSDAQSWQGSAQEIRQYVDIRRRSHYLEGEYSECIMPNWELLVRESILYADIGRTGGGELSWTSPADWSLPRERKSLLGGPFSKSFRVAEALEAVGAFTVEGLKIMHDVWGQINFAVDEDVNTRTLKQEMLKKFEAAGLITERADRDHIHSLYRMWQMPMYNFDFGKIEVPLDKLRSAQESLYSEDEF